MISVIVPVYNVERYLGACLDSLASQVFDDFEVVIVNDGSTDGSVVVAESYVSSAPDMFRLVSRANGGLSGARNLGMLAARGEYFAFVDADDVVAPEFLSAMYGRVSDDGADLVLCGITGFGAEESPDARSYLPEPDMGVFGRSLAQEPRLLYRVDASACNKLYSRELFARADIVFPPGMSFEDVPTTYRLLSYARCVSKVDQPLYFYRQSREGSITHRYGPEFMDLVAGMGTVVEHYRSRSDYAENSDALLRLVLTHLVAGRYPDLFLLAAPSTRRRFVREAYGLLDRIWPDWRTRPVCRELWVNPLLRAVSTHEAVLLMFCRLPRGAYLRMLSRLSAFDPKR